LLPVMLESVFAAVKLLLSILVKEVQSEYNNYLSDFFFFFVLQQFQSGLHCSQQRFGRESLSN